MTRNTVEAVQKMLGEPVFIGLSERAWKTRTLLLIVCGVALGISILDLRVARNAAVFGLSFEGVEDDKIRIGFLIVIAYMATHFLWEAWDSFVEWRLRLTGNRVSVVTVGRSAFEEGDYPTDPRQSTLANWWRENAKQIGSIAQRIAALEATVAGWEARINAKLDGVDRKNFLSGIGAGETLHQLAKAQQAIEHAAKTITSARIPASLDRFEGWFSRFASSQNLRWLLFDVGMPLFLATTAIVVLATKLQIFSEWVPPQINWTFWN